MLSCFRDVSVSHILLQNLKDLQVPELLNRETLGADHATVMELYGNVKTEAVEGLGEQFDGINKEPRNKAEMIYQHVHQI
jgi:hypothetical protein